MHLKNIPTQILCLDLRWDELGIPLMMECRKTFGNCFPFLAGKGEIFVQESYDHIDFPESQMGQWGYGTPEGKIRHANAFVCHQKMLWRAIKWGLSYFLLLEDDAVILSRIQDVWPKIQQQIEQVDWDIIYLSYWLGENDSTYMEKYEVPFKNGTLEPTIIPVTQNIGGLHAALINHTAYYPLLGFPANNPLDSQLNHSSLKRFMVVPKLVHTKSTFSYCEGLIINRVELE